VKPVSDIIRGARVWLVEPDWQARVLVRAQLVEEGSVVTALEDWGAVEELLQGEVTAPQLLIAELTGQEPPAALALLYAFPARRLVRRVAGAPPAEALRAAGVDEVLSRPCSVEEIVTAARRLLLRPPVGRTARLTVR
jgi:hypothetical protein